MLRRPEVRLVAGLLVVYALVLWWISTFDGSPRNALLALFCPVMLALLVASPLLAWDGQRLRIRLTLGTNLNGVVLAALNDHRLSFADGDALRSRLRHADPATVEMVAGWLRRNRVVERTLPGWLDLTLDLTLLIAGAVGGTFFADALFPGGGANPSFGSLTVVDSLRLAAVVMFGIAVALLYVYINRQHARGLRDLVALARRHPQGLVASMRFDQYPELRQKLVEDLSYVSQMLMLSPSQMRSVLAPAGVDLRRAETWRTSSLSAFSFKLWQCGMGFILGAIAEQLR